MTLDSNCWMEGSKQEWIFYARDNSSLDGLSEKIDINEIQISTDDYLVNLGIKRINGRLYSGNYVGICRLKSITGKNVLTFDDREAILRIEPRFNISVVNMLNLLREDDEFERYLAPQTMKLNESDREIEDLKDNELFHFYDNEDPIYVKDNVAINSSIITSGVFITMLKGLCSRPLMGKMICKEENLTGKVKGKILFNQNIRKNTLRGRDDRIFCRYLKYSEDILENQILKAALKKTETFLNGYFGSTSGSKNSFREMISYCRKALAHVSEVKINRQEIRKIKTQGVYIYYKPVINAAKMVLSEITIEANGNSKITSYVVPYAISMDKLFEMYVRAYLKKCGVESYCSNGNGIRLLQYDKKTPVFLDTNENKANYIKGNLKPDIVLYNPENDKYVIFDVKYKDSLRTISSRADRLQILAYSMMYDCTDIGNIFPAQQSETNTYYLRNKIESRDSRPRYYNQIELSISNEWSFTINAKDNLATKTMYDFLKEMLS